MSSRQPNWCYKTTERAAMLVYQDNPVGVDLTCYKIVFGLSHLDFEEFFQFAKVKSTRANHSYKLYCKLSRINCFKYSFFNNVISYWNNLPSNVVEAGTLFSSCAHFERLLVKCMR